MFFYGYGVSTRNIRDDEVTETVPRQQLDALWIPPRMIYIDVLRYVEKKRPRLDALLKVVTPDDTIVLHSIETLLQGDLTHAVAYYTKILDSGAKLLAYDLSGSVCRYSEFSTTDFYHNRLVKTEEEKQAKIAAFAEKVEEVRETGVKKVGHLRKSNRVHFSPAFEEIYFAYESYQLDLESTEELLRDYIGICHKITFWEACRDFERGIYFPEQLDMFASSTPEILKLPKRIGNVPDEFFEINDYIAKNFPGNAMTEENKVMRAMTALRMLPNYGMYQRWTASFEKRPKPRKPQKYGFSVYAFREKYKKIEHSGDESTD